MPATETEFRWDTDDYDGWAVCLIRVAYLPDGTRLGPHVPHPPFAATWVRVRTPDPGSSRWHFRPPYRVRNTREQGIGRTFKLRPETYIADADFSKRFFRTHDAPVDIVLPAW